MQYHLKNNVQTLLRFWILILFFVGLLFSRALLSLSTGGMFLLLCFSWKQFTTINRFGYAYLLLLVPVIVSGIWSSNSIAWWRSVEVKLSLPIICTFLLTSNFSFQQTKKFAQCFMLIALASTAYSILYYCTHKEVILQNYLMAKVMPVSMDNDHIRYSWLIVLTCIINLWLLIPAKSSAMEKWLMAVALLYLVGFLHFLAAKTGLLCLYVAFLIWVCFAIKQYRWFYSAAIIVAMGFLFAFAYQKLPSLKNRISYVLYDFSNYSKGNYTHGSSDGARVLSLKAGLDITKQHPFIGVGFGDLQTNVIHWHSEHYPHTLVEERFLPTNEWLIYSAGAGIIGLLCFATGIFLLLQPLMKKNAFTLSIVAVVLVPLCTDDSLEGQYGVCIVALFVGLAICLQRHFAASATA